jgi:hypothetical protein
MSVEPCGVMMSEPAGSDKQYWSHRIILLYKNHEEQPDKPKTGNLMQCPRFTLRCNVERYKTVPNIEKVACLLFLNGYGCCSERPPE